MELRLSKEDFQEARATIQGVTRHTPIFSSRSIGARTGLQAWLKAENLQKTGSFKPRGATNMLRHLSPAEREIGVITASSGNHGQAIAYVTTHEGIPGTVVMPETANKAKVAAVREYGAEVVLYGPTWDEAYEHSLGLAEERGLVYAHPFKHPHVMAGQGTAALEILDDLPDVEAVLIPIGGGGLIGGIAQALKLFKPAVRVIGVEAAGAAKMVASREEGQPAVLDGIHTIADGLASKVAVPEVFEVLDSVVDEIVTVTDQEMLDAIRFLLQRTKLLAETAGAATTAALLTGRVSLPEGTRTVAVISGGNYDVEGYLRLTKEPQG